jgi:hypothetical protein
MKKNINLAYAIIIVALLGFVPFNKTSAATVYLESSRNTISVGDTVIVNVKINAEGTTINTVDGDVAVKTGGNSVMVQEFSLANSAFGLWPRTPSLSKDGQVVSFVGGVPGGFNIEGASLFKVILQAKKEGTVTINPQNIVAFANDGKGTKLPVKTEGLSLTVKPKASGTVAEDEWAALVAKDITQPEDFIIVSGQDPSMFEGKKFAYFSAVDNQTGVAYYEVSENGAPVVRSGSVYVYQDQSGKAKLSVTAYDKAGNKKVEIGSANEGGGISWFTIIISLVVILVLRVVYMKLKKNKKNVSNSL